MLFAVASAHETIAGGSAVEALQGLGVSQQEDEVTAIAYSRTGQRVDARERAIRCAQVAADNRGKDIVILDMTEVVEWLDYLVIVNGASRRQLKAIADDIEKTMADLGEHKTGAEGYESGNWVVLDFGDVMIHIFDEDKRQYYQLDQLWGNAPSVEWAAAEPSPTAASPAEQAVPE